MSIQRFLRYVCVCGVCLSLSHPWVAHVRAASPGSQGLSQARLQRIDRVMNDYGWDGAASTYFRIDPKEDLVILLMTHRMPCDDEIQIKLKTLVYQALTDPMEH